MTGEPPGDPPEDLGTGKTMPLSIEGATPAAGARRANVLAPGDLLATRYRVVRVLGAGGMGEVYEADDLLLKTRVALKTLRRGVADGDVMEKRFLREIQLARKVTHAGVCRIFDAGVDAERGIAFLTMELIDGETLADRLRRVRKLPPAEALPIARQVAAALA